MAYIFLFGGSRPKTTVWKGQIAAECECEDDKDGLDERVWKEGWMDGRPLATLGLVLSEDYVERVVKKKHLLCEK